MYVLMVHHSLTDNKKPQRCDNNLEHDPQPNLVSDLIMNINLNPFNTTRVASAAAVMTFMALSLFAKPEATEYKSGYDHAQPSDYGVQTLQVNGETGIAVIKLDGFRVQVSFDFESYKDSYGVPGSDFTAVEITNLAVDQITDANGNPYNDFTDYNDHCNINLLLSTFIEKNNLVEV